MLFAFLIDDSTNWPIEISV